jgi:hypothetical protein
VKRRAVDSDVPVGIRHTRDRLAQLDDLSQRIARMQDKLRSSMAPTILKSHLEATGEAAMEDRILRRADKAVDELAAGPKPSAREGEVPLTDEGWEAKIAQEEEEVARGLQSRKFDLTLDELAAQEVGQYVGAAVARADDAARAEERSLDATRSRGARKDRERAQAEKRQQDGEVKEEHVPSTDMVAGSGALGGNALLGGVSHRPAAHGLINIMARVTVDNDEASTGDAMQLARGSLVPSMVGMGRSSMFTTGSVRMPLPAGTGADLEAALAAQQDERHKQRQAAMARRQGLIGSLLAKGATIDEHGIRSRLLSEIAGGPDELRTLGAEKTAQNRIHHAMTETHQVTGYQPPRARRRESIENDAVRAYRARQQEDAQVSVPVEGKKQMDPIREAQSRKRRQGVTAAESIGTAVGQGAALLPMNTSDIRSHVRAISAPGAMAVPGVLRGGVLPLAIRRLQAGDLEPMSVIPEQLPPSSHRSREEEATDAAAGVVDMSSDEEGAASDVGREYVSEKPMHRAPSFHSEITWEEVEGTKDESFGPPGPPQFVKVVDSGFDWIAIEWSPPAYDGGTPVVDYVIRYSAIERKYPDGYPAAGEGIDDDPQAAEDEDVAAKLSATRGEAIPTVVPKPPYRTTQFVGADPICHQGAVLRGLRPGVWYTDIRVSAVSLAGGESEPSIPTDPVRTTMKPPLLSAPRELELMAISSRGFDLQWLAPFFTVGQQVRHFVVRYTVHSSVLGHDQQPKSKRTVTIKIPAARSRVKSVSHPREPPGPPPVCFGATPFAALKKLQGEDLRAYKDADLARKQVPPGDPTWEMGEEQAIEEVVTASIRGLMGNQRVVDVSVVAVSLETGKKSEPAVLGKEFVTLAPTRRQSIMAELNRVQLLRRRNAMGSEADGKKAPPLLVDTAFLTNALQRVEAGEYERRLWSELQEMPDPEQEARRKAEELEKLRVEQTRAREQLGSRGSSSPRAHGSSPRPRGRRRSSTVRGLFGEWKRPEDDDAESALSDALSDAEREAKQAADDLKEQKRLRVPQGVLEVAKEEEAAVRRSRRALAVAVAESPEVHIREVDEDSDDGSGFHGSPKARVPFATGTATTPRFRGVDSGRPYSATVHEVDEEDEAIAQQAAASPHPVVITQGSSRRMFGVRSVSPEMRGVAPAWRPSSPPQLRLRDSASPRPHSARVQKHPPARARRGSAAALGVNQRADFLLPPVLPPHPPAEATVFRRSRAPERQRPQSASAEPAVADPELEHQSVFMAKELRRSTTASAIMVGPGPIRHTAASILVREGQRRREWSQMQSEITTVAQMKRAAEQRPSSRSIVRISEDASSRKLLSPSSQRLAGSERVLPAATREDLPEEDATPSSPPAPGSLRKPSQSFSLRKTLANGLSTAAAPLAGFVFDITGFRYAHMVKPEKERTFVWGTRKLAVEEEERKAYAARYASGRRGSVLARQGVISGGGAFAEEQEEGDKDDDEKSESSTAKLADKGVMAAPDEHIREIRRRAAQRLQDEGGVGRLRRVRTAKVGAMHKWGPGAGKVRDYSVKESAPDHPFSDNEAQARGLRLKRQMRALDVIDDAKDRKLQASLQRAEELLKAEQLANAAKAVEKPESFPSASIAAGKRSEARPRTPKERRVSVASVEDAFSVLAGWRPAGDTPTESEDEDSDGAKDAAEFEAAVSASQQQGGPPKRRNKRGNRRMSASKRRALDTDGARVELERMARREARKKRNANRDKRRASIIAGRRDAKWLTDDQKEYLVRKHQFSERVIAMNKLAAETDAKRRQAEERLRDISRTSQAERIRIGRIMAEIARAVRGDSPSWVLMSSVRTGAPQEFEAARLTKALADEVVGLRSVLLARGRKAWTLGQECRRLAVEHRVLVASTDAKKAQLLQMTKTMQGVEKARRGGNGAWLQRGMSLAMADAMRSESRHKGRSGVMVGSREELLAMLTDKERRAKEANAFLAWKDGWKRGKQDKAFLRSILLRMLRRYMSIGFTQWVSVVRETGEWWKSQFGQGSKPGSSASQRTVEEEPAGIGSLALLKATGARRGMMATAANVLERLNREETMLRLTEQHERWKGFRAGEDDEDSDGGEVVGETTEKERRDAAQRRAVGLSAGAAAIVSKRRRLAQAETGSGALALATGGAAASTEEAMKLEAKRFAVPGCLRIAQSLEERTLQRKLLRRLFEACTIWDPTPLTDQTLAAAAETAQKREAKREQRQRKREQLKMHPALITDSLELDTRATATPFTQISANDGGVMVQQALPGEDRPSTHGTDLGVAEVTDTPLFAHVTASAFWRSHHYDEARRQFSKIAALCEDAIQAYRERVRTLAMQATLLSRQIRVRVAKRIVERKRQFRAEAAIHASVAGSSVDGSWVDEEEAAALDEDDDFVAPLGFFDAEKVFDAEAGGGGESDDTLAAQWDAHLPPPTALLGEALAGKARSFVKVVAGLQQLSTDSTDDGSKLSRVESKGVRREISAVSLSSLTGEDQAAEAARRGWRPLAVVGLVDSTALDALLQLRGRITTTTASLEAEEIRRRALTLRVCECAARSGDIAIALDGYSRLRQGFEREGDFAGAATVCEREAWLAARRGQLRGAVAWIRRAQRTWIEAVQSFGEAAQLNLGMKMGAEIAWLIGGNATERDAWLMTSILDARTVRLSQGRQEATRGLARVIDVEEVLCALTGDEFGASQARARRREYGMGEGGDGVGVLKPAAIEVPSSVAVDAVNSSIIEMDGATASKAWEQRSEEASVALERVRKENEAKEEAARLKLEQAAEKARATNSAMGVRGLLDAARERRRASMAAADNQQLVEASSLDAAALGQADKQAKKAEAGRVQAMALEQRLAAATANLALLESRLHAATARNLADLSLEQVSAAVPPLRAKVRACHRMVNNLHSAIEEMVVRQKDLGDASAEDSATLAVLRSTTATHIDVAVSGGATAALDAAKARRRGNVISTQRMTVAEARFTIQARLEAAEREREELTRRIRVAEIRISNLQDTLESLTQELGASTGALAAAAMGRRAIRAVALYQWNAWANNIIGRGRVWAQESSAGEVEVACPNCGAAQVMGGKRGRTPLSEEDEALLEGRGGPMDARAKLLALRRAKAKREAASTGGKGAVSSVGTTQKSKKGKGKDDESAWERTPLSKFVSAKGRALRKSSSAVVGAAKVAQAKAAGDSAASAVMSAEGEADSFDLLTGGGASAVGEGALAEEGRNVFDDDEDQEAEDREGVEAGSILCSDCGFTLGGALLGLCPYLVAVQGDDVVVHRMFRTPEEIVEEEKRFRMQGSGTAGEGKKPGEEDEADQHPLAKLRMLRAQTAKKKALLDRLIGASTSKNRSEAQRAAAELFAEEESEEERTPGASDETALAALRSGGASGKAQFTLPPVVTKAVRIISGDWRALATRGVRGLGHGGGLSRGKQLALLVTAGRMGSKPLIEHFAGPIEASSGIPGQDEEEDGEGGKSSKGKGRRPTGPVTTAQDLASQVARGLLTPAQAERERARLEEEHRDYLESLRKGHGRAVTCVAMTATRVYTGSADASIRVWNWRSGEVLGEMSGHRGTITCLALDVDARTLVSGSADTTARLWDTLTFRCLRTLRKHEGGITCLTIFRDMFVTGSSDCTVGVWDLSASPLRNEAADQFDALAEHKLKQEGEWAAQLEEIKQTEASIVAKLDNDDPSDEGERQLMGRAGEGSDGDSIKTEDLFQSSSESSEVESEEQSDEKSSGDVSTTDSDDPLRERRITVREKEGRMLDELLGDRNPPRYGELKVRVNKQGRLAGVGYTTFSRGFAYKKKQQELAENSQALIKKQREIAIKRGENRVVRARQDGDEVVEDDNEDGLVGMFNNLRSNLRARREALKKFQKMRVAEKRRRRRQRWRLRRLAAVRGQRRDLTRKIAAARRHAEQRLLSLQRQMTRQKGAGAYSEGDGVVRITAESMGFDIDREVDTLQTVIQFPRSNLLLDVHTAPVTSVALLTPHVVSGDAIGVVIFWDVIRAVPLRVFDTQPDMPLPPRVVLPAPRVLREAFGDIKGVVGVVRKRRKLPDGRVITYTAGLESETHGAGAKGLAAEDLGGLRDPASIARVRDLAADAVSSSSEDDEDVREREKQRLAGMTGRERAYEQAKIAEGKIARALFLEALTGLPASSLGSEEAAAISRLGGVDVSAGLPKHIEVGPRKPADASEFWVHDAEGLRLGRKPGELTQDRKTAYLEAVKKRRQARRARADIFSEDPEEVPITGLDGADEDDPLAAADHAAELSRQQAREGLRRHPVMSIFLDTRRVAAGIGNGAIQVFDLMTLVRLTVLRPAEVRQGEAVSGHIRRKDLRLLRGGLSMDSRYIMGAYNDGRVRRWALYSGDGDEEAAIEAEERSKSSAKPVVRPSAVSGAGQ